MFKKSLSVLDIFSGIGGFSLGLEKAGMQTVAFCEINPSCRQILKTHWGDVPIFSDITSISKDDFVGFPQIDVIAGGFPCQDISCAGKQKGISANRSGLWKEFKRLINELKPKYAIIENVANLRGNGLITVLQDLWEIGYNAEWHCIPASAFGAPHRRDRIWIVAYPSSASAIRLPVREEERLPVFRDDCKNASDTDYRKIDTICKQEKISSHYRTRGIEKWGVEPESIPRLTEERLNPDWVEWLMGFPKGWTEGGSRKKRLVSLGNAVVPMIPEFLGEAIVNNFRGNYDE